MMVLPHHSETAAVSAIMIQPCNITSALACDGQLPSIRSSSTCKPLRSVSCPDKTASNLP